MSKLILNPDYGLYERNGEAACSTLQVAETFGKEHKEILKTLEGETRNGKHRPGLLEGLEEMSSGVKTPQCSSRGNTRQWFEKSSYTDASGKRNKMYLMNRDGFTLLVMGFTGKKAMAFKVYFIERFNAMEEFIKGLLAAKIEHPAFTEAVMLAHDEPKHYHFSNEADMINRIVLGMPAAKYRELHGIEKKKSIRPYVTQFQIEAIGALQRADIGMLDLIPNFEERKLRLADYYQRWLQRRLIAA